MGLIHAAGNFCYVECDTQNCTKKIEHIDERVLRQLAGWSGWERQSMDLPELCEDFKPETQRSFTIETTDAYQFRKMTAACHPKGPPLKNMTITFTDMQ